VNDVVKLRVRHIQRLSPDRNDARNARIVEALEQHALPHHAGCTEDDDDHDERSV